MPMTFSEEERKALSTRLLVQPPPSLDAVRQHQLMADQIKRIEGLPIDVLETLEAIRMLAESGNRVAKELYEVERERLGIDVPRHFGL